VRVLVVPADVHGCGFYRLIAAAEHLKMLGHDIIEAAIGPLFVANEL